MLPPKKGEGRSEPNTWRNAASIFADVRYGVANEPISLMDATGLDLALRRKVLLSNAPIVRLHERGAGVFCQLEEFLRRFQLTPNPAQWVIVVPPLGTFSTVPRPKKRGRHGGVPGMLWVI
jgi:hypothetical protein